MRRVAAALGLDDETAGSADLAEQVAASLEAVYAMVGVPVRVGELGIPRSELPAIAALTVKNFNFNPGARSAEAQVQDSLDLLEAAW